MIYMPVYMYRKIYICVYVCEYIYSGDGEKQAERERGRGWILKNELQRITMSYNEW